MVWTRDAAMMLFLDKVRRTENAECTQRKMPGILVHGPCVRSHPFPVTSLETSHKCTRNGMFLLEIPLFHNRD